MSLLSITAKTLSDCKNDRRTVMSVVKGDSNQPGEAGVTGTSEQWNGMYGEARAAGQAGIAGVNENGGNGVYGRGSTGVHGHGTGEGGSGVAGASDTWNGVFGVTQAAGHAGVAGVNENGGNGLYGRGFTGVAGHGTGEGGSGVVGTSDTWNGVFGVTQTSGHSGVAGVSDHGGNGLYGRGHNGVFGVSNTEGGKAAFFQGNVVVTGDLELPGADYAEALTVAEPAVTAGMVVVLDDAGRIRPCTEEYDSRVAGIVSGAGGVRPALVLDRHDGGAPVALMGKLWALADASEAPIRCGDLLTTSSTPGHARRITERERGFGAVVGKALTDLASGHGMVRVLVTAS
jgi:hypothetical protein